MTPSTQKSACAVKSMCAFFNVCPSSRYSILKITKLLSDLSYLLRFSKGFDGDLLNGNITIVLGTTLTGAGEIIDQLCAVVLVLGI
jgi:hypothetical protein